MSGVAMVLPVTRSESGRDGERDGERPSYGSGFTGRFRRRSTARVIRDFIAMRGTESTPKVIARSNVEWEEYLPAWMQTKRLSDRMAMVYIALACLMLFSMLHLGQEWNHFRVRTKLPSTSCKCSSESRTLEFVKQPNFDVCKIACTETGRFAFDAPESQIIEKGFQKMSFANVHVCLLMRDAANLFENATASLEALASKFESTHVTIIENDSVDNTAQLFATWGNGLQERNDGLKLTVDVEHHSLRFPSFSDEQQVGDYNNPANVQIRSSRYHRMSLLRNRCLLKTMMDDDYNQLLVMDMDDEMNNKLTLWDGLAHSYGLQTLPEKQWDVVCANGVLPEPPWKTSYYYRNLTEKVADAARRWVLYDSLAFRSPEFDLDTFRFHEKRIHTPYDEPFYVDSCFGGLAVYNLQNQRKSWHACSYRGFADDDCEHVSFHECLKQLDWKILFNPRMLILYDRDFKKL